MKIDCEGHYLAVLRGFREALEGERVDVIQFEYNHSTLKAGDSLKEFFTVLEERYAICRLLPAGLDVCAYYPVHDNFAQTNRVAVRPSGLEETTRRRLALRPAAGILGAVLRRKLARRPKRARQLGLASWALR